MQSNRRDFLKQTGAAMLMAAAPGDRINVGFIGLGNQGTARLREFMQQPDVNVAGLCDVDNNHLDRAAVLVSQHQPGTVNKYRDFRKLIERKDIDAVMVATPDHWHALPLIHACHAGKDVFVEKPLCYSIGEGRAMVAAAKKNSRITQLGNHIHNDYPNYRRVVEIVRSGMLGKIDRVSCWKRSSAVGLGNPPDGSPPKELDYDFWLGPAPKRSFNPNRCHQRFRNFWDYSGGIFIDFWCHVSDVAYWALDLKAPLSIAAMGSRRLPDDNGETPIVMEVEYDYPGVLMTWTIHPQGFAGFEQHDLGCAFQGSEATLVTTYTTHELYIKGKKQAEIRRPPQSIPDSPGHIREFLNSIKSRQATTCNVEYAYRLTKAGLLGNLAYRAGKRLYWDDARERISGDAHAQSFVTRRYRRPWKLA